MIYLLYTICILTILNLISFLYLKNWNRNKNSISLNNESNLSIYLLLPIYFEQEIIIESILKLSELNTPNITFVFITSEKEEILAKKNGKISSKKMLELNAGLIQNRSIILEKKGLTTSKSLQIIEAQKFIKSIHSKHPKLIGVLDFDSDITDQILQEVLAYSLNSDVIQVLPIPLKKVSIDAKNISSYSLANLIAQTFRCVAIEKRFFVLNKLKLNIPFYLTGACLFFKESVFNQLNLNEKNDDLFLSKQIDQKKYIVNFISKEILTEPCPNILSSINQTKSIFSGILVSIKDNFHLNFISLKYFLFWIFQLIEVAIIPIYMLISIILFPKLFLVFLFIYLLKVPIIIRWINSKYNKRISYSSVFISILFILIRPYIRMIGFFLIFFNLNQQITKTPRINESSF